MCTSGVFEKLPKPCENVQKTKTIYLLPVLRYFSFCFLGTLEQPAKYLLVTLVKHITKFMKYILRNQCFQKGILAMFTRLFGRFAFLQLGNGYAPSPTLASLATPAIPSIFFPNPVSKLHYSQKFQDFCCYLRSVHTSWPLRVYLFSLKLKIYSVCYMSGGSFF